ncbi:MAG: hypothetical protein FWG52_08245 [Proteobacteria bacterium]|nr:hypothetical protein [Pseudomonadota bacterium]
MLAPVSINPAPASSRVGYPALKKNAYSSSAISAEVLRLADYAKKLIGDSVYSSSDLPQEDVSVDVDKKNTISARFDEIAKIQDGWFEGGGLAPDADKLTLVSEKLIADYPSKLPIPQIAPKQDGNLLLEWKAEGDPSLDIDLTALQASFHVFGANGEDVEHDFNLDTVGWESLFAFLGDNIKAHQA